MDLGTAVEKLTPLVGVSLSILSLLISVNAFKLARKQDERKKPRLVLTFLNCFFLPREQQEDRIYAFLISIANRSDSGNSVASVELHLTYRLKDDVDVVAKFICAKSEELPLDAPLEHTPLAVPIRIEANQTMAGWCLFRVPNRVAAEFSIQKYNIILADTHGNTTAVEPVLVQEFVNAALPKKNKAETKS